MLKKTNRVSKGFFKSPPRFEASFSRPLLSGRVSLSQKDEPVKISVIVPRKVSTKAVERNKIRRRVYQASRSHLKTVRPGRVYLLYPKKEALNTSFSLLQRQVADVLENLSQKTTGKVSH